MSDTVSSFLFPGRVSRHTVITEATLTPAQRRAIAHKNAAAQRTPRGPSDPF